MSDVPTTVISDDNIGEIINAARSVVFSLSERYGGGFEEYIAMSLQDVNSDQEKLNQENEAEFWNTFIIIFIEHKDYALESIHNHWVTIMENSGWGWNTQHRPNQKMCPLLIEYTKLTLEEQSIVRLFAGIVWALAVQEEDDAEAEEPQDLAA